MLRDSVCAGLAPDDDPTGGRRAPGIRADMVTVAYSDGPGCPLLAPAEALAAAGLVGRAEVLLGWMPSPPTWIDDPHLEGATFMAGYGLAAAIRDGRLRPLSTPLSKVPDLLRSRPPAVAVISAVRRGSGFAFGASVGWADVLAIVATRVVVEVDDGQPDLGGPEIVGNIVAEVARPASPGAPSTQRSPDAIDSEIAERVVPLIPEGATLELGVGATADAIALRIREPIRLWTGLLTETAAELHGRGLVVGPVTTAYTWGGRAAAQLHADGLLDLVSTTVTHDPDRLASIPRLVACNGALQVGLDGSVNLERVGGRHISGIGGHRDFSTGASRSPGGISVVVVRSTTSSGGSSIVPSVDVVSTGPEVVGVVVTEHGIADLRGVGAPQRAGRLIEIAAPAHREALRARSDRR